VTPVDVTIIATDGSPQVRSGFDFGVPGLVVVRDATGVFAVVHVRSGFAVGCAFESPEPAVLALHQLAGLADWTQPGSVFVPDADLEARVFEVTEACGATAAPPVRDFDPDGVEALS